MAFLLVAGIVMLMTFAALRHRRKRLRLYQELAGSRTDTLAQPPPVATPIEPATLRSQFERARLVRIDDFLEPEAMARLRTEAAAGSLAIERSYLPGHKKGGTLSYEAIHRLAPGCLALYHSPRLRQWLADLIGAPVQPTPDSDQSSCSILYYDQPGDHIGWHFDYNFYRGRHFTVLLSLVNHSATGGLSSGHLERRLDGERTEVPTPTNALVVFEGARVFHRATPVEQGDERVILSMTFCTDPRSSAIKQLGRRIKDIAYFGPRALLD